MKCNIDLRENQGEMKEMRKVFFWNGSKKNPGGTGIFFLKMYSFFYGNQGVAAKKNPGRTGIFLRISAADQRA